jgi:hypothetical protein
MFKGEDDEIERDPNVPVNTESISSLTHIPVPTVRWSSSSDTLTEEDKSQKYSKSITICSSNWFDGRDLYITQSSCAHVARSPDSDRRPVADCPLEIPKHVQDAIALGGDNSLRKILGLVAVLRESGRTIPVISCVLNRDYKDSLKEDWNDLKDTLEKLNPWVRVSNKKVTLSEDLERWLVETVIDVREYHATVCRWCLEGPLRRDPRYADHSVSRGLFLNNVDVEFIAVAAMLMQSGLTTRCYASRQSFTTHWSALNAQTNSDQLNGSS